MRRAADFVDVEEKVLRKVLEKARVTASSATSAVRVFVVKNELVGCCSLGVSVIRALYTMTTEWSVGCEVSKCIMDRLRPRAVAFCLICNRM